MCGRYAIAALPEELFAKLRVDMPAGFQRRFNVAPTQDAPIVRRSREDTLICVDHRWGLVPYWATDPSIGNRMINARSESAATKPAFREALLHRRCLVPSTGFFEWQKIGRIKQPFLIARDDHQPFVYAGLWERWKPADAKPEEPPLLTFTILTCPPSEPLRELHDRMPVILTDEQATHAWLDPSANNPAALTDLLRPVADDWLTIRPVSRRVNKPEIDDPSLIEPIPMTDLPVETPTEDGPTLFG